MEQKCYEAAVKDYDDRFDEEGNLKPQFKKKRGRPKAQPPMQTATGEKSEDESEEVDNVLATMTEAEKDALLAEWEARAAAGDWPVAALDGPKRRPQEEGPVPSLRVGKHAKQRGSNFTPPKQRKKRR